MYAMVDEATQFILAYWICFGRRGGDALACLLRDCIRRHGRLPWSTAVDQGGENIGLYYTGVTAIHVVDYELRGASASRWGGVVEAFNHRSQQRIFHQLPGNTKNDRLGRSGNKQTRSDAHAKLEILRFLCLAEDGINLLNDRPTGTELPSPGELLEAGNKTFATLARRIELTGEVLAATAIPVEEPRVIHYNKGIRFERRDYTGTALHDSRLDGQKVPIRYEPYDPTTIYACIHGSWYALHSAAHTRVQHLDQLAKNAELYYQFDTGGAQKAKKNAVDFDLARGQADHIRAQERSDCERQEAALASSAEEDIFAQIRRANHARTSQA
ncbi:Mu transposase C-terminal domain-containing protein [Pinirhizobacter soli]|uniref:Mu transposase C-terminal domain-containing protein n=1 Tax=Pinirhizobacter soli TaxID=2786953 RepID=UPI00202A705B|nr:Mu transposase C-terminal domain-containing protein [Pinirhizobacter soli]